MNEDDYYTHVPLNVVGTLKAITPERLARLLQAEVERDEARARLDCVAERDRLAIAAVDGVQQLRIDLAAARAERDALRADLAALVELGKERDALQAQVAELITGLHTEQERTHRFLDRAEKAEVERDELRAELEREEKEHDRATTLHATAVKERDALAADAARYRWLRGNGVIWERTAPGHLFDYGIGLDAAIDFALTQDKP